MNKKLSVFVDSDAFVAAVKIQDATHTKARRLFEELDNMSTIFITSNYIFSETVTVLSQKMGHEAAVAYIEKMKANDGFILIERVDESLEEVAIKIFKAQTSKNTSFVDCVNMAILKKLEIDAIFSFDEVYRKNGFLLLEDVLARKK